MLEWLLTALGVLWLIGVGYGIPAMLCIGLLGRKPWPPFEEIGKEYDE